MKMTQSPRDEIDRPSVSSQMPGTSRRFCGRAPRTPGEIYRDDVREVEANYADRRHDSISPHFYRREALKDPDPIVVQAARESLKRRGAEEPVVR